MSYANFACLVPSVGLCALTLMASACDASTGTSAPAQAESAPAAETAPAAPAAPEATVASIEQQVSGLWFYTGLTTGDGTDMPLSGVFLFKDGIFVQQAVFDSSPFEQAGSMAHAGPYRPEPATGSVHLVAEQTISTAPGKDKPLGFRANTDHDVTVTRTGDSLRLIFGMGTSTVQDFTYVGPGDGELYALEDGTFALVDGHFVLVEGDENGVTSGYGTYEQDGDALTLNVIRWSQADTNAASNQKDTVIKATFDGQTLTLEDGTRFNVAP